MQHFFSSGAHPVIRGAFFLTAAGILTRVMGFFYRIFLSRTIGAEQVGIYQMIFPVYGLLCAVSSSGIQTAISRLTAAGHVRGNQAHALRIGLLLSVLLSLCGSILMWIFADSLASVLLLEARCAPLLRALALAVPLSGIHACISGYYYGLVRAAVPSLSLLAEQSARMLFVYLAWKISLQKGIPLSLLSAVYALTAGELAAVLFCITALGMAQPPKSISAASGSVSAAPGAGKCLPDLLALAIPLTANRLFISLLSAGEATLLPAGLKSYGYTPAEALSLYGIFSGMAMPLILFPTAITNAVSVLLLPEVARTQSGHEKQRMVQTMASAIWYCLILGIFFFGVFFLYGNTFGTVLYHQPVAGQFLKTLSFICPFLYLHAALSSILAGLGQTTVLFWHNALSLLLRLCFVCFWVPRLGMQAYFLGLLVSLLCQTALDFYSLRAYLSFSFPAIRWILLPGLFLFPAAGGSLAATPLLFLFLGDFPLLLLGARMGVMAAIYFLMILIFHILPANRRLSGRQSHKNSI